MRPDRSWLEVLVAKQQHASVLNKQKRKNSKKRQNIQQQTEIGKRQRDVKKKRAR